MLSLLSLIGKFVEFVAKGLQSANLSRASDKRGQACQTITRLYYLLIELKSLASYMGRQADHAIRQDDASLLAYSFRDAKRRIQASTNDFVETFYSIAEALDIFAPDLAEALSAIMNGKLNLLWMISQYEVFEPDDSRVIVRKYSYLNPDDRLLDLDIEAVAKRLVSGEAGQRAERFEWPDTLFHSMTEIDGFSPAELNFVSIDEVRSFARMLDQHGKVLNDGIVSLKEFIRNTFTIDEVLYEDFKISPEWYG
jgi:hypothetical protein